MDAEPAALRRARLVVAYDGAPFHGFAENEGVRTVLGDLRAALERVARRPLDLVGAGRTDAGVHAWGQVVSGDLPAHLDLADVARRVSKMCGPSLIVRSAAWVDDPDFSARFSAVHRHYRYHVLDTPTSVPAWATTAWHVDRPLDLAAMRLACDPLIGEHDFSSFCRRPDAPTGAAPPSMRRRVLLARWSVVPDDAADDLVGAHHHEFDDVGEPAARYHGLLRFEVRANAFCHQMVRSMVGTLVDVGLGRLHAGDVRGILLARDRRAAGRVAPPHGLTLWEVGYPATGPGVTGSGVTGAT
jgi:tRNA pseudouridine38-40 synthase